jgi:tetratricopeptide (TPR) repeat protein
MQALAMYHYPVPAAAVDYLLQPHQPGIDSSRVLSRLVNMQFARRDAGRYYLHQVDREYALERLPRGDPGDRRADTVPFTRFGLRHRAAEWFKLSRKPREAWKTLDDLAAQLAEFELRCRGDDYDTAAALLLEFDFDYLFLWGHYRLMTELHEALLGKIQDHGLAESSIGNLGSAYYRMGDVNRAMGLYEQALEQARRHKNLWGESVWLGNISNCFGELGETRRAIASLEQALTISQQLGDRKGESLHLGRLANRYAEIGENQRAFDYTQQTLVIDRETGDREGEALDLHNLGHRHHGLGRSDLAKQCHRQALRIARGIGYRLIEASVAAHLGAILSDEEDWDGALRELETAIEIAEQIGASSIAQDARDSLALLHIFRNDLREARRNIEAAGQFDVPMNRCRTATTLGAVRLLEGDGEGARAAFTSAISGANDLLALTPERYEALDIKGLSSCGLVICGDSAQLANAKAAFAAARAVTRDAGITRFLLRRFDALARADAEGRLGAIRPIAAGAVPGAS